MHAQTWASYNAVYRFHSLSLTLAQTLTLTPASTALKSLRIRDIIFLATVILPNPVLKPNIIWDPKIIEAFMRCGAKTDES